MTVKISTLWFMWLGGILYDIVCSRASIFPDHTPEQRFSEDFAVAWFIIGAWILSRWLVPAALAISRPNGGTT